MYKYRQPGWDNDSSSLWHRWSELLICRDWMAFMHSLYCYVAMSSCNILGAVEKTELSFAGWQNLTQDFDRTPVAVLSASARNSYQLMLYFSLRASELASSLLTLSRSACKMDLIESGYIKLTSLWLTRTKRPWGGSVRCTTSTSCRLGRHPVNHVSSQSENIIREATFQSMPHLPQAGKIGHIRPRIVRGERNC